MFITKPDEQVRIDDELVMVFDESEVTFILTEKEMEAIFMELKNIWISRDNELAMKIMSELVDWCLREGK